VGVKGATSPLSIPGEPGAIGNLQNRQDLKARQQPHYKKL